jgi:hypothetical protein
MAATEQATRLTTTRTLHLVDADNLLGDPLTVDPSVIRATFAAYRRAARFVRGDHAVVASCADPRHAFQVRAAWPGVLHRWRGGPDGADLALLEEAEVAARSRRYGRVVLGSGDRIFLVALDVLRSAGVEVQVVSRRDALARALRIRALAVTDLDVAGTAA